MQGGLLVVDSGCDACLLCFALCFSLITGALSPTPALFSKE